MDREDSIFRLLIIRHAPAGGAAAKARWRGRDALRPLSPAGREKMRRAARGLARVAGGLEAIATSPRTRARQTAEIVARRLGAPIVVTDALQPQARPRRTLRWLAGRRETALALVGHEPQLGLLIAWLCAGSRKPITALKKGQACLLELRRPLGQGGRILWSLAPAQLRRL